MKKLLILFICFFVAGIHIFSKDTNNIEESLIQDIQINKDTQEDKKENENEKNIKDDNEDEEKTVEEEKKPVEEEKKEENKKPDKEEKPEEQNKEEDKPVEEDKKEEQPVEDKKEEDNTPVEEEKKEDKPVENEESKKPDKVTVSSNIKYRGSTYTGLPSLSPITYTINPQMTLDNTCYNFSFGAATNSKPHSITISNQKRFDQYRNVLAYDNKTNSKILYLTFDCGYEYKNLTSEILDILDQKQVKGAFFVTGSYIKSSPYIVARMINEGHIVGNHTDKHPNATSISKEDLAKDVLTVHNQLRVNFGYNSQYFRFPSGSYSSSTLDLIARLEYKSVFWSLAHTDWDPDNQPGVDKSFTTVTSRLHPGAVILLHTTSPDNVEILADFIDYARNQGYTFKSLNQYGYWE